MTRRSSFVLEIAIGVALGLVVMAAFSVVRSLGSPSFYAVFVFVNVVVFLDLFDVLIRLYVRTAVVGTSGLGATPAPSTPLDVGRFTHHQKRLHVRPYALLVSVHNAADELQPFIDAIRPHIGRLWIIDDASTDRTSDHLALAGCRCIAGKVNQKKPGAIRTLLSQLPPEIETVVVFDPDTALGDPAPLETVIFDFQQSGMAALCPRVAIRPDGLLSSFQEFEYALALGLGRKALRNFSTNSGISIYRREALESTMERHSLSVYAEDLENSVLLLSDGEHVYFDDRLVVETDGKTSLGQLFSQRVGWAFGHIRVYAERLPNIARIARRSVLASYQYLVYLGVLGIVFHPLRCFGFVLIAAGFLNAVDGLIGYDVIPNGRFTDTALFLTTYAQYFVLTLLCLTTVVPRGTRLRLVPIAALYLFYAMFLIVPTTLGFVNWISVRCGGRRFYIDHYDTSERLSAATGADMVMGWRAS